MHLGWYNQFSDTDVRCIIIIIIIYIYYLCIWVYTSNMKLLISTGMIYLFAYIYTVYVWECSPDSLKLAQNARGLGVDKATRRFS